MKLLKYICLLIFLTTPCYADVSSTQPHPQWQEVDGSPIGRPRKIVVSPDSISFVGSTMSLDITTPGFVDSTYLRLDTANDPVTGTLTISPGTVELTDGKRNIIIGVGSGASLSGNDGFNVLIGENTGAALTTATYNYALGHCALEDNTAGRINVALGPFAMQHFNQGVGDYHNVAVGWASLAGVTPSTAFTGNRNVGIGSHTLHYCTTASGNTGIGMSAGFNTSTGSDNIFIGKTAGESNTTGSNNIIIGVDIDATAVDATYELNIGGLLFGDLSNGYIGIGESVPQDKLEVNGTGLFKDKLKFTQDDGNEYIDSLIDGELDLEATTSINGMINGTEQIQLFDGKLAPTTDNDIDLGDATHRYKEVFIYDGIDTVDQDLTIDCGTAKTLVLATSVYKDINMAGYLLTKPASSAPNTVTFVDENGADTTIETYGFAVGEKVHGGFELQHDYKQGTDLVFHVHWQGIVAPISTDNVQWRLNYIMMREGATLDAAVVIDSPDTAIDTQYEVYKTDFAAITGTNFLIEDQFMFTLTRVAATGNAYGGDALIGTAGIHYEVDTMGSRTIAVK